MSRPKGFQMLQQRRPSPFKKNQKQIAGNSVLSYPACNVVQCFLQLQRYHKKTQGQVLREYIRTYNKYICILKQLLMHKCRHAYSRLCCMHCEGLHILWELKWTLQKEIGSTRRVHKGIYESKKLWEKKPKIIVDMRVRIILILLISLAKKFTGYKFTSTKYY